MCVVTYYKVSQVELYNRRENLRKPSPICIKRSIPTSSSIYFRLFLICVVAMTEAYKTYMPCQQRTLTPPDTWSCPTLGLACVLMSRPISSELVLSPDFCISNIPRYFSFAIFWFLKLKWVLVFYWYWRTKPCGWMWQFQCWDIGTKL